MQGLVRKTLLGAIALTVVLALLLPFVPASAGPISVESGGAPRLPKLQLEQVATASLPACAAATEGTLYYDTTTNALSVCNASANVDMAGAGTCTSQFVRAANAGAAPTCAAVTLGTDTTGTLGLNQGGSAKAITASNGAVVYSDADSFELSAAGASGQCLKSGGAGAPTWGACDGNDGNDVSRFGGYVSVTDVGGAFATTFARRNGTSRKLTFTHTVAGSGAGSFVVELYNVTTSAIVCSVSSSCDAAVGTVVQIDCSNTFLASADLRLRVQENSCATDPAGNAVATLEE